MKPDPEQELCKSWSIGRLRPWLQMIADRELPAQLRGRVDPSDIVQQTLMKAWQGESDFAGSTHEQRLAWLRSIMKNAIRDQHRRLFGADKRGAGREQLATDVAMAGNNGLDFLAMARDPTASSEMAAAEDALALANAIEKLPLDQRRVIELRHFSNLSYAMIAEQLNKSEPAVRMLWVRALRNLQSVAASPS
ncbi:MAG: sigma-70 family RNA polymerase sigma factor [Pirellula staleyi]